MMSVMGWDSICSMWYNPFPEGEFQLFWLPWFSQEDLYLGTKVVKSIPYNSKVSC